MSRLLIILSLCGGFILEPAAFAHQTDGSEAGHFDKNKFDFYNLRSQVQKYQDGKASLADIQKALAELKKDGFQGPTEPNTLTAEQAKSMQVTAENTCGVIRIYGPAGMLSAGFEYTSAAGRAAAMARATNFCVSGFRAVDEPGTKR
jgi:hypothetical protein